LTRKNTPSNFDKFWKYFLRTWINIYDPTTWNINHIIQNKTEDEELIIINRTNNPLERFNRQMNDAFPNAHPNMENFVETINKISTEKNEELLHLQKNRKMKKQKHNPITINAIPADYLKWKVES
jgi:hypothetical protein